jgi:hypothetical protein
MRWTRHVTLIGKKLNAHRELVNNPEWNKQLGRTRHSWEDHIKMVLKEIGGEAMNWFNVTQDRVSGGELKPVVNIPVLWTGGYFLTRRETINLSRRTLSHGVIACKIKGCSDVYIKIYNWMYWPILFPLRYCTKIKVADIFTTALDMSGKITMWDTPSTE